MKQRHVEAVNNRLIRILSVLYILGDGSQTHSIEHNAQKPHKKCLKDFVRAGFNSRCCPQSRIATGESGVSSIANKSVDTRCLSKTQAAVNSAASSSSPDDGVVAFESQVSEVADSSGCEESVLDESVSESR